MADSSGPSATPEDVAKAEEHKNKANEYFKDKKYVEAVEFYTRAIDLNPSVASYYGNRSIAHLRTEAFGYALQDASKTLELDKNYIKGYYRRASAYMAMGKFKLALKDYELVKKVRSKDKDAIQKYEECNKIVKWMAFQKAIAVDTTYTSVADSINLDTIDVEDSYSGPKLDDDISAGFMKNMLQWFKDQKKLHKKYCYKIMLEAKKLFEATQTLCDIKIPDSNKFTVCGDIHGQFYDLLNIFELNGVPSQDNPYLFNGDFVDRGSFSFEVILVLFGYKVLYPQHFYMARGNHESINMNQMYGFEGETKAKYSSHMFELFTEIFNWLPLAHCINEKVLVMHGGLFSRDDVKLDEIRKIDRFRQPSDEGLMCELLWSDPQPMNGRSPSKRGVGIHFGPDVTEQFCSLNKLEFIIRSHEVKDNGYELSHNGKCITVFSAPNYCEEGNTRKTYPIIDSPIHGKHDGANLLVCHSARKLHYSDQMGNKGAFITLTNDLKPKFTTYEAVPHPNVRPMQYANPLFGLGF